MAAKRRSTCGLAIALYLVSAECMVRRAVCLSSNRVSLGHKRTYVRCDSEITKTIQASKGVPLRAGPWLFDWLRFQFVRAGVDEAIFGVSLLAFWRTQEFQERLCGDGVRCGLQHADHIGHFLAQTVLIGHRDCIDLGAVTLRRQHLGL